MKKNLLHLLLVLLPLVSFAQEDSVTLVSGLQDSKILEFFDVDGKELNLELDTINEALFLTCKNNYDDQIVYDSSNVAETEKSLYIKTLAGDYDLQDIEYPNSVEYIFYGYAGFLKPLNLHFYYTSSRIYEYLTAIDCFTGKRFSVDSFYKFNLFDFLLSKENDQLLIYRSEGDAGVGSGMYPSSEIKIFQVKEKKVTELSVFFSEEWNIAELVWIDEHSFALKTFTEESYDQEKSDFVMKDIQYLKATIVE